MSCKEGWSHHLKSSSGPTRSLFISWLSSSGSLSWWAVSCLVGTRWLPAVSSLSSANTKLFWNRVSLPLSLWHWVMCPSLFLGKVLFPQAVMVWEWVSKCHCSVVIFKRGGSCERTKTTFPLLPHGDFYITLWGAESEEITLLPVERESISSCLTGRNVGFSVHMSGPCTGAAPPPNMEAEIRYKESKI